MQYSRKLFEKILPQVKNISDEQLIEALGSIGVELPKKDIFHHPTLNNVVFGRIINHTKHPDSDHLNICKVQIDKSGSTNTIVCGASNVTDNKLVVVALEGCKLFDGREIVYKELRGTKSEGMLCGYHELTPLNAKTVSKFDSEGIILLDLGEAEIGDTNVAEVLGLNDTIYEIEVPFANRNDINGAYAFCQDIAGFFG
jgi:phenylalanyl-tRNA synthetase beta chain